MRVLHLASAFVLPAGLCLSQTTTTPKRSTTAKRSTSAPSTANKTPAAPAPMTDEEKTIYAIGLSIAKSLTPLSLSPSELQLITRALTDSADGNTAVKLDEWGPKIRSFTDSRRAVALTKEKSASTAYLQKAATEPGAVKTESGLVYRDVTPGTGASPKASDTVKVNYRGTLIDGTEFDSSYRRSEPATFPLTGVVPCWTEGIQKMKVGGKAVLVCPSDLAYGDEGRPSIPAGAALIFEVELLDIVPGSAPAQ